MIHADRYDSLGALLDDVVQTYKSRTALVDVRRTKEVARLSFADLRDAARHASAWLRQHDLVGKRVVLAASNHHRWLVLAMAVLRSGAVLVPLDAKLTPDEIDALLAHAGADAVALDGAMYRRRSTWSTPIQLLLDQDSAPEGVASWSDVLAADGPAPLEPRGRDDLATLVYSSGTGGRPKGCKLTHGAYLAQYEALSEVFRFQPDDRYLSILPSNHALGFMVGFLAPLGCGAQVVQLLTVRPAFLTPALKRYRITHLAVVPLVLTALERALREKIDALDPARRALFDGLLAVNERLTEDTPRPMLSRWLLKPLHDALGGNLRTIFAGGAFVPEGPARFLHRLGLPVAIGYGLTEGCAVLTLNDLVPFRADSVGRPLPGTEVRILNPGPDGVGEVAVRGPTLFSGYLDDPELTERTLHDGWLHTGDLGWLDGAHHLHLVGRARNLIVTPGGKNIYPEDVEHAFSDAPVAELALYAEDYLWPRRDLVGERLIAVVRPDADTDPDAVLTALRRANRSLPEHKRASTALFWSEDFPRTTSLKVKRNLLADQIRDTLGRDAGVVL